MAFQQILDLPIILKILEARLPKDAMPYNLIKILIGKYMSSTIGTKVFRFIRSDKNEVAVEIENEFIVIIQYRQIYNGYAVLIPNPEHLSMDMKSAFEALIDWSLQINFSAVDDSISKFIAELCEKHGILKEVEPCNSMTMKIGCKALDFDATTEIDEAKKRHFPDSTVYLKELSVSDALLVTKRWIYALDLKKTEEYMKDAIRFIGSAGVFVNEVPISWVLIYPVGSINALHTEEPFRGKGIGMLSMKKACKTVLEKGWLPTVQVNQENTASRRLMEKVGMSITHSVAWIIYAPKSLS